ncbi:group 1 glycosyl transferase [Salinisphaera sp. T5B8]|uniref:glycosyltransferase n=1 Tax=Salinisphaera sp. T5B8 TaxID=1304154 RepID=UPI003342BC38
MRILHRINLDVPAGVEHQFCAFLGHPLVQAAFDHDVVYGSRLHPDLLPHIAPFVDTAVSFKRAGRLRLPRRPLVLRERALAARIKRLHSDIVFSWSGFARTSVAAAARASQTPLVYREGGGCWFEHPPKAAAQFIREISGAICNTRASMRMLQLKWGYDGPARVCLGGIRPEVMRSADATDVSTRTLSARRPRIGVAARLASEKGVCLAIHALKHLRAQGIDCELQIAGEGPDRAALEALSATLGLQPHLRFLGRVSDMPAFYRSIDVLLHPALQEPLGNVTIEAQAFGVPVVATRVDGMAETVVDNQTGRLVAASEPYATYQAFGGGRSSMQSTRVYDPDSDALRAAAFASPEALAEAVAHIVGDSQVHSDMAGAAAAHARERFSFERHIDSVLAALKLFGERRST